jgi:hypothetical protein
MPDGTVIQNVPEGLTQAELLKKLKANGYDTKKLLTPADSSSTPEAADAMPTDDVVSAPAPVAAAKQVKETALEKIPYVGKPLAFLADIPMGIMKGTGAGVEAIAGAAGAGTDIRKAIKDVQEMVDEYMSASSKEDAQKQSSILKEAEDKGILRQVAAGINAFAVAPIDTLTQAFGTAAAPIGATAAATYAGAPAAVVTGAGVVTGGIMGLGVTKNAIYDAVREEYIKVGVPEAKAEALADAAQAYSGENLGQILLGGTLGAISGVAGIEGALSKVVGQRVFGRLAAEKAGKEAAKGVGRRALGVAAKEGIPEFVQGAQEKLATNLALQREGFDVDTMRGVVSSGTLEGIAGAGLGAGIGAVSGGVDGETETETNLADSPDVEQEFYRLVTAETQALREQNPDLTQRQAYNQVVKDAGRLYDTAIANTMFGTEGDIDVADADTGVDDFGGIGTGTAADIGAASSVPGATDVGETIGGGLEQSVSRVSVPTTGTDAGVGALDEAKQILGNKKIKLTERVDVARQLLNDTILNNKLVNDVDQKQYDAAKNQLANGKHNGDPMAALEAVTGKKFAAPPLPPATTVAAPTIEAAPSVDEVAVAPVKAAIKSVTTTTPDTGPIPSLAQASAQQLGITSEAAPDVAVQETVQEDVQEAPVFNLADYTPQEIYDNLTRFGYSEAERRGYVFNTAENGMFGEGVREAKNPDIKPLTDEQVLSMKRGSPEVLAAYKEGQQWGKEQVAAVQAAPDVAVQEDVQGYVDTRRQELAAQEAADAEAEATLRQEIEARKQQEEVAPALVTEEVALEPAPLAEEVVQEPVQGAAAEADPYTDVLADIEAALADEAIDERTYKLLTSAVERRLPLEKIEAQLDKARTRSAEQAMGSSNSVRATPNEVLQSLIYRMQDAWRVLTGKPILANARLTDLLRDPDILDKMNPAQRGLAAALADVIDDDVDVYIGNLNFSPQEVFTLGVASVYDGAAPDVRLRGVSTAANIVTLLHEAVHIALIAKFGSDFKRLTDLGPDADPEMLALRDEVYKLIDAYNTMFEVESSTDLLLKASPYGMKNLDEFIAEGLTQPSFQKFLEKGNLWTRFVALVRKLLKLQPKFQPQLDNVLKAGAKLITASKNIDRMEDVGRTFEQRKKSSKPKVVSNGKQVVLTEAQKRTALAKAKAAREKMNRIQKRIASTNDTADVLSDGIDLVKLARGDKENLALLRGAIDTVDVGKWQLILPTLSTEDIFRILKGRIPGLTEADRIIQQDVTRFQTKEYLQLADELERVAEFLKKYPKAAQALSDLEFATVAYQVDPTKAATPEEYAKLDKKTKELQTELGSVTAGDVKGKKKVEDKIARRLAEIKSVYVGVPGDERVLGWRDLGRPEFGGGKGREIFKLLRDGHRRDLEAKYNALRDRLKETKKDKDLAEALEKLEAQFKPALEQVIYFPAMRFGSYYARVGTGANSIFKMFETQTQRNKFVRVMEARGQEVTETGNVEDLRNNFEQVAGGPLKEVLDLFGDNPKDIGALKSQVFDLWLQTMSAGDMRKHMAPRKMRAGYSTDILKNFANFRRSSINDVKRAKFGEKLRTEISRAKDMVKDMPDREKMNAFIKEIELRTLSDLMPAERGNPYWEGAIQLGNKMAFYQYLANPKTALIQLTQLHIVALPILAQKYGTVKANAALAKYGFSSLGGFVVSPLKAIPRPGNQWTFDWEQPNLLDNPISALKEESDPELYELLSEGWIEGRDLNLWMDTFANQIGGYGNADPQQSSALQELMKGRVHTAAWRGTTFAFEAMGTLMHQMERVNREATYMAALELAYRENKKNGQTHTEAKKNAIEAAVETTLAATFDFSSYNKPRVLNTGVGRLAGQFMSYPYMMVSLLGRNVYTAIRRSKNLEPGERLAAIQTATGVLFNIGLYAGLTGVPLYGFFTTIASLLLWAFDDDDEEEGGLSYIDEDGNIKATYNIDWWVRNVWIPKTFGADGTVANLFDLDDGTAEVLARSVEKGPISAITDIDLSNSVALDVLFFVPRESREETPEGKIRDYTFSVVTGAFGNTVMDYVKAGKDLMNGYTDRALERLPKLFGNVAKANRFATEGQTNYNRELVGMDADFWSSDKAILQALSFASTEADQRQQQNYEAKNIKADVAAAREDFLNKLRKTALDRYQYGSTPETDAAQQQIVKDWVKFNRTYPTNVIGLDSFYEVQNNAVNAAAESRGTRGLPIDEKTPYLRDIYLRRLKTEEK